MDMDAWPTTKTTTVRARMALELAMARQMIGVWTSGALLMERPAISRPGTLVSRLTMGTTSHMRPAMKILPVMVGLVGARIVRITTYNSCTTVSATVEARKAASALRAFPNRHLRHLLQMDMDAWPTTITKTWNVNLAVNSLTTASQMIGVWTSGALLIKRPANSRPIQMFTRKTPGTTSHMRPAMKISPVMVGLVIANVKATTIVFVIAAIQMKVESTSLARRQAVGGILLMAVQQVMAMVMA